jgi:hypothetical protein
MSGEVVNLREAARLTGWSVKTLRRRCVSGQIAGAQKVQGLGAGEPEWVIPVESLPHRQDTDRATQLDRVARASRLWLPLSPNLLRGSQRLRER